MNGGDFVIIQGDQFAADILSDHADTQLSWLQAAGMGTEIALDPLF
jgi:hypothetical protein